MGRACACVATLLRNFAAYAAALAGFTAAILASDTLGATGGTDGHIFNFAVMRVSEIWIGIVCAGIVLAGTDFGAAPRRLAKLFADLADNIVVHFRITLTRAAPFSGYATDPTRIRPAGYCAGHGDRRSDRRIVLASLSRSAVAASR